MTLPRVPARFSLAEQWVHRAGSGWGVRQAHGLSTLSWTPGDLSGVQPFVGQLQALLDEPLADLPPQADLPACAAWVIQALGALLRYAQIPSVREMSVRPIQAAEGPAQQCVIVVPVFRHEATLAGLKWLLACLNDPPETPQHTEARFFEVQQSLKPYGLRGANHWRLLQAAYDEHYPVVPHVAGVACIGTGVHRRWFQSFVSGRTAHLAMQLAQDKHRTALFLRMLGWPGAQNVLVNTAQQALAAAQKIGYPLVVKPNDKDRGEGVAADLASEAALLQAFEAARQLSTQVLVEKFQPGFTHRFTVVQGQVIRVAQHRAFGVEGDGHASIAQLVQAKASGLQERKRAQRKAIERDGLDEEALGLLAQYGWTPQDVPAAGAYVKLRRKDNVSAGGRRVTLDLKSVHPDNLRLALDVSEQLGLDFAGIDFISPDVGRSWREVPATICEINGNPQLVARDDPEMYKRVLRHVMPAPFRVPSRLLVLPAAPDAAQVDRWQQRFSPAGSAAGLAVNARVWLGAQAVAGPFASSHAAAVALSINPQVRQLTVAMTVQELLREGLPLDRFDMVMLPWARVQDAPQNQRNLYQRLMLMVQPHAEKITTAKPPHD